MTTPRQSSGSGTGDTSLSGRPLGPSTSRAVHGAPVWESLTVSAIACACRRDTPVKRAMSAMRRPAACSSLTAPPVSLSAWARCRWAASMRPAAPPGRSMEPTRTSNDSGGYSRRRESRLTTMTSISGMSLACGVADFRNVDQPPTALPAVVVDVCLSGHRHRSSRTCLGWV